MERVTADRMYVDLEAGLVAQASAAGILASSTAKGRAREQLLAETLAKCLPGRLHLEQGEVVDRYGRSSGEADLVVVDSNRGRRVIGGESVIPVEAAVAVIEVKSSLRGAELESAVRKIARIKTLKRGPETGMYASSADHQPRIAVPPTTTLGVIFGYTAPSRATLMRRLGENPEWHGHDFMARGPDVIGVVQRGVLFKNDLHLVHPPPGAEENAMLGDDALPVIQVLVEHLETLLDRYRSLTYPPY